MIFRLISFGDAVVLSHGVTRFPSFPLWFLPFPVLMWLESKILEDEEGGGGPIMRQREGVLDKA